MRFLKFLVLALAVTTGAFAAEEPMMEDALHDTLWTIEGSWELDVRADPGPGAPPPFTALATFSPGGGVVETIVLPPVVPAHGAWTRNGRTKFTFTVLHPLLDANGNHYANIRATSRIRMTSADEFTADFDGHVLDRNGNVLGPITGTETGRRIRVE